MKKIKGMRQQILFLLLVAGVCGIVFFSAVYLGTEYFLENFSGSVQEQHMMERRAERFKDYVEQQGIAAGDSSAVMKWCRRQPMVLMEIYRNNRLLFNSNYMLEETLSSQEIEVTLYSWYTYHKIEFADGQAEVLVYSDEGYVLRTWILGTALLASAALYIFIIMYGIRRPVRYIYLLCNEVQNMGSGDMEHPITVEGANELGVLAGELEQMRRAMVSQQEAEQRLIRQKNDMVTGLSHDLRTPLTKMLLYAEILKNRKYSGDRELQEYLDRIFEKGQQLREMSEFLLQYSLRRGEEKLPVFCAVDFFSVFYERTSELMGYLAERKFSVHSELTWDKADVVISEFYLNRIMDNVVSNIVRYADPNHPVFLRSVADAGYIGFSIVNSCREDCPQLGCGVGLSGTKNMMAQMGGRCEVIQSEHLFEIRLMFQRSSS